MRTHVQQRKVFCLPVDIDEVTAQFFQHPHSHAASVDAGYCAADFASQGDCFFSVIQRFPFENRMHFILGFSRDREYRFQYCSLCSAAHHGGIHPAPHQCHDRIQQDRFSRSGFTGNDDQSFFEFEFKALDDGKVFDA